MTRNIGVATRLFSLAVFIYVLLRAALLDITYDEAWSIGTYVNGSFTNILLYEPCDSNNHLLNSLLIKLLYVVLPENTFVARLPGLLALIFYLHYAIQFTRAEKTLRGFLVFICLALNPFLLEFFGLARGYAFATASVMATVYYLSQYFQNYSRGALTLSLLWAGLAGLSILSFLNFFAGVLILIVLHLFLVRKKDYVEVFSFLGISAGLVAAILWVPLHRLTQFGNLYYGGTKGLWSDTFLSLGRYTQYQMFETSTTRLFTTLYLVLILFLVAIRYFKQREATWKNSFLFTLIILCLVINHLQVLLVGGYYLIDRTALFLYPLILLMIWQLLKDADLKKISLKIFFILVLLNVINFALHANISKTLTWYFDAHTRAILSHLNKRGEAERRVIPVGCSWPFEKTLVWYLKKGDYPHVTFRWDPDYYLYLDAHLDQIDYYPEQEKLAPYKSGILLAYPAEHVFVLKR